MAITEECQLCKFWQPILGSEAGNCRRNPPVIVDAMVIEAPRLTPDIDYASRWPMTGADDWCGRWTATNETTFDPGQGWFEWRPNFTAEIRPGATVLTPDSRAHQQVERVARPRGDWP